MSRAHQTKPPAPPPPTLPPKSPPLHQSAPVGKDQDNKTVFEQFEYNSDLYCYPECDYCISESVVTLDWSTIGLSPEEPPKIFVTSCNFVYPPF